MCVGGGGYGGVVCVGSPWVQKLINHTEFDFLRK